MYGSDAWTTPRRAPRYYPDAVTLTPSVAIDPLLSRIDASAGCSIKDSFATLDLASGGFEVLFDAEWICRHAPPGPVAPNAPRWEAVRSTRELTAWEAAWAGADGPTGLFRPELLEDPSVVVLGGVDDGRLVAGAILNHAGGVAGLTNVFTTDGDLDAAWAAAVAAAGATFPNDVIAGYESGADLAAARRHGFATIGRLRVWMRAAE